ncbi:hypothetical protein ACWC09_16930 [Streptomyces sp. NPDC001617]
MAQATSESYVRWVNAATGDWGTWEPYETVALGDVGYFNPTKKFVKVDSALNALGVQPAPLAGNRLSRTIIGDTGNFSLDLGAGVNALESGGTLTVSIDGGAGCILYIEDGEAFSLANEGELVRALRETLAAGQWRLDWVLVTEHLRAYSGFAAIFQSANASVEFSVSAPVQAGVPLDVAAGAGLTFKRKHGKVSVYPFTGCTPTFDRAYRVYPGLRNGLYGGKVQRTVRRDWYFRPRPSGPSVYTAADVRSMPVHKLFENDYTIDTL